MCNANCIIFGVKNLIKDEVKDKRVVEVGALDLNGSLRSIIEPWGPGEYIGVDILEGPGVDIICKVEDLVEKFGKESFDIVIATELLEHIKDWKKAISNLKSICKTGGLILITTRSRGFAYHSYPYDFWRYEIDDMKNIFSDYKILVLQKDPQDQGVFIKIEKPDNFMEKKLPGYQLYNIISNKRLADISSKDFINLHFFLIYLKQKIKKFFSKINKLF